MRRLARPLLRPDAGMIGNLVRVGNPVRLTEPTNSAFERASPARGPIQSVPSMVALTRFSALFEAALEPAFANGFTNARRRIGNWP